MSGQIPARQVRVKSYLQFLRDYDETSPDNQSIFIYADTGADVPNDEMILPFGTDVPPEKLRLLSDILGSYARQTLGWKYFEIGGGGVNVRICRSGTLRGKLPEPSRRRDTR